MAFDLRRCPQTLAPPSGPRSPRVGEPLHVGDPLGAWTVLLDAQRKVWTTLVHRCTGQKGDVSAHVLCDAAPVRCSRYTQTDAAHGVFQTLFVLAVLGVGALFVSRDLDRLVLRPIERMMATVRRSVWRWAHSTA